MPRQAGRGAPVLAVDVGGTTIKSAVLNEAGAMGAVHRTPTPRSSDDPGGAVTAAVAGLAARIGALSDLAAIGLTVPGIVDEPAGIGIRSTNLGWQDYPFTAVLQEATGLPVALAHDVRAAGDAEARIGAGQGYRDVAVVTIGTGIAAALHLNGQPYRGRGLAGELGHTVVDPGGEQCLCGNRGCLEAIASAGAIVRRYQRASGNAVDGARGVLERRAAGDPDAERVWHEALVALATGLAQLAALVAPEAVIIGGGLAGAGEELFGPLPELLRSARAGAPVPVLVPAALGPDAGTWGAAFAARDLLSIGLP